ncbi:bactofilin family protein [Shewanella pneumatophori]|uniref:Polymer-forming cytoskeletal protein n=1 Tax=Shewanella pneumatophori TaxID=314092 RepID=A0A9X1ZEE7_9GAMM|nr:polymer-forming cytoskeletal protein [Shewanella pneumatophori]MCL1139527.1 polymer-forming cytoskeletal protein [Shewanella pneumatophori]
MFRKKRSGGLTFIAQSSTFTGDTEFTAEALIAGTLKGNVSSSHNITIEQDGLIEGKLHCIELRVSGTFKGKLNCEKLNITSTGLVDGEVNCQSMEIFEGGQFIGMRVRDEIAFLPSNKEKKPEIKQSISNDKIEDAELTAS